MGFAVPRSIAQEQRQGIDYENVPDKYIQETRKVYQECAGNHTRSMFFDCKCFSMEFLDERIYRGPVPSTQQIEFSLQKECRDATGAAGYEYSECLRGAANMAPGTDPEEMCACYANRFAKLIDFQAPVLQSRTIRPFKLQAKMECTNPALARKIFNSAGIN